MYNIGDLVYISYYGDAKAVTVCKAVSKIVDGFETMYYHFDEVRGCYDGSQVYNSVSEWEYMTLDEGSLFSGGME